jgi:hypothetical protein
VLISRYIPAVTIPGHVVDNKVLGVSSLTQTVTRLLSSPAPDALFHYTSYNGLTGIAGSGELWASEARYLNDSSELDHGIEIVRRELEAVENATKDPRIKGHLYAAHGMVQRESENSVLVASFSEDGDELSQWRAYCRDGGCAIGLSGGSLQEILKHQNCLLTKAIYDDDEKRRLAAAYARECSDLCLTAYGKSTDFGQLYLPFTANAVILAAIMKHQSFRAEREWRAIAIRERIGYPTMRYRIGKSTLVPYVGLKLPDGDERRDVIQQVIASPSPHASLAARALEGLLHSNDFIGATVSSSSTPFRDW